MVTSILGAELNIPAGISYEQTIEEIKQLEEFLAVYSPKVDAYQEYYMTLVSEDALSEECNNATKIFGYWLIKVENAKNKLHRLKKEIENHASH